MARTTRDARLESRSARAILPVSAEPRWKSLDTGLAIGYRRNKRGGAWLARRYDSDAKRYREAALGLADDQQDADGVAVLNFSQAQAAARAWFAREERGEVEDRRAGPYTVADATRDYLAGRERRGSKGVYSDRRYAETRIIPTLGNVALNKLTAPRLRRWHEELAAQPKLVRSRQGVNERAVKVVDLDDVEAVRSRRATANRVMTILKAALNVAFADGKVASDIAWRRVKPFKAVEAARIRWLDADEIGRLVAACEPAFADIVRGALLTGARYGELARMVGADFDPAGGTIAVRIAKSGKPRRIALTDEGVRFFAACVAERPGKQRLFLQAGGRTWNAASQQRPLEAASKAAGIAPPANFHALRHTYASTLAAKGVAMRVISDQLGHADTRITEKHYAHFAPSFVAQAIRAGLPDLGLA